MKNFKGCGEIIAVPAPADVLSGAFVVVGSFFGVAQVDALSGVLVPIVREGIFELPKATGTAWTKGDKLYWDAGAAKFTKTAAGNLAVGVAAADAASGDAVGDVSLEAVSADAIINGIAGVGAGYKIARGVHQQAAASDTVATGLSTVVACGVTFRDGPTVKQLLASASIGDQAGAPAAGSILINTFKPTAVNDVTPTPATDFTDNLSLNWWAIGT